MTNSLGDRWLAGDAYESYMGRWSRLVSRAFVEWLHPEPSANWLEVGCGTGALTSTICELGQPASVTACDPSEPFVEHARRNISDARVSFLVAGADALPRRDGGFDETVSGLVLNFLPDPGAVLASLCERLRKGGVVAGYVWDYADGMEFLKLFWQEAAALDPRAASLDEGRRFPLCSEPALDSLFRGAGLARVETHAVEIETNFTAFGLLDTISPRDGTSTELRCVAGSFRPRVVERASQATPPPRKRWWDSTSSTRLGRAWGGGLTSHRPTMLPEQTA